MAEKRILLNEQEQEELCHLYCKVETESCVSCGVWVNAQARRILEGIVNSAAQYMADGCPPEREYIISIDFVKQLRKEL